MKYLIRKVGKKNKAHLWTGEDSYCNMYTTGGMRKTRYELKDEKGDKELCLMCTNVFKKIRLDSKPL